MAGPYLRLSARGALLLLFLVAHGAPASAQIAECRDADGKALFAPSCPPGTTKLRDIEAPPLPAAKTPADKTWQQRETEFQIRQNERRQQEAAAEKQREQIRAECANTQRQLNVLLYSRRLITRDATTGNPEFMDDEERERQIQRFRALLEGC